MRRVFSSLSTQDRNRYLAASMERRPLMSSSGFISDASIKDTKQEPTSTDIVELHYAPRAHKTRRPAWPLAVVGGQLVLLALAYGFFAALHNRGQIPLSRSLSELAQRNPQSKTYVVTFVATALSAISSFLFSQAVRHALLVGLSHPMSISTLGFGVLISRRSLVFRRRQIKWGIAGGVFFLANLGQTASWTSLITPIQIVIPTPLQGTEIDFLSETFNNQFDEMWNATPGLQSYINSGISSVMDTSGAADATALAGSLSVVDFAGWVYPVSTRGILPVTLVDAFTEQSSSKLLTTNTKPFPPAGSAFNMTMVQQGLTALTTCKYQHLDATTDPPLERFANSVEITVGGQPTLYTAVGIATTCGAQTLRSDVLSSTNNTLLSCSCAGTADSGDIVYTVIIDGQGLYDGTVVCSVIPKILTLNVAYSDQYIYTDLSTPIYLSIDPAPASMAYAALYGFDQAVSYGQSATQNIVGDSIATIFADESTQSSNPDLWELYIRGVVEFVGTAVKTEIASPAGPLGGSVPSSMRRAINGTAFTTTFGWEYTGGMSNAILIPSTFVALASILIVLFAQCVRLNRGISIEHADFDPNDPLLLMAAASAGGMGNTFRGLSKEELEEGGEKRVILARVGNRDGFVEVV
ncbi:hypothetical protein DFH09DRAFT_1179356 [Mycena vulgaris]|nr:hypothetical protein DFH09DRAFT_1179356 [Mycena vulgaris]